MKKLILLLALVSAIGLNSCSDAIGGTGGNDRTTAGDSAPDSKNGETDQMKPEYLTYDSFLEKVWNFEENPQEWVYEGDVPCVIDFYADWCRPCRMVAPIMDDLAKEYHGKVKIYKIDVDKEKKLASVFQVRSIPSVLFSPVSGRPMMQAGALPKDQYVKIIEENLLTESK